MSGNDSVDVDAIKIAIEELEEAYVAGNLETFVALFTDDAVCMLPNQPPVVGKNAWRADMRKRFERSIVADHSSISEEVVVFGDWAFERHNETARYTSKATGESNQAFFKGVFIFRRQPDGSWKIARYISNGSPAPEN
jgi:uncharacterized protein (TIGR02246 family)